MHLGAAACNQVIICEQWNHLDAWKQKRHLGKMSLVLKGTSGMENQAPLLTTVYGLQRSPRRGLLRTPLPLSTNAPAGGADVCTDPRRPPGTWEPQEKPSMFLLFFFPLALLFLHLVPSKCRMALSGCSHPRLHVCASSCKGVWEMKQLTSSAPAVGGRMPCGDIGRKSPNWEEFQMLWNGSHGRRGLQNSA